MAASAGQKYLEQHIAEIIWFKTKTNSAPKLEIKKSRDGEGKMSYLGVSHAKRIEQLGTDPPTKLS